MTPAPNDAENEIMYREFEFKRIELEWEQRKFRLKFIGIFIVTLMGALLITVPYLLETSIYKSRRFDKNIMNYEREIWENRKVVRQLRSKIEALELRQRNSESLLHSVKQALVEAQKLTQFLQKEQNKQDRKQK
ncbi:MAG: hypothetical protein OXL41_07055 [Nitrospinae bacterium]|nr:hypothetical protein [Nitrospinota bacterium]